MVILYTKFTKKSMFIEKYVKKIKAKKFM